jgi:hypothetical protein
LSSSEIDNATALVLAMPVSSNGTGVRLHYRAITTEHGARCTNALDTLPR